MRRGELLSLRFGDVDFDRYVIHIRPENAKSKKSFQDPASRPEPVPDARAQEQSDAGRKSSSMN
jgi:integrase